MFIEVQSRLSLDDLSKLCKDILKPLQFSKLDIEQYSKDILAAYVEGMQERL
jgi:hypothetical protein